MEPIIVYSRSRIRFISNDRREHEYCDRSVVQLIETDFPNAVLRGLDVENNRQKIFEIPLRNRDQYKFGDSINDPDEVRNDNGIYQLWLHDVSLNSFHEELRKHFEKLDIMNPNKKSSSAPNQRAASFGSNRTTDTRLDGARTKYVEPKIPTPSIVSPKDFLLDVQLLNRYIEQGDSKHAAQIASQLASHNVSLVAKSPNDARNEQEFLIQVQLDGNEYGVGQQGARIPVNVFQSTTIRELRALFELAYSFPPTNQYFFVNGSLAYDYSTMKDLNVGPKSLFILFLLTHSRKTQTNPWGCSLCGTKNQAHQLRCTLCSAKPQQ